MNKQEFYKSIRTSLFNGILTQGVVDTVEEILAACVKYNVTDPWQIAYCLGTGRHESYSKIDNPQWLPVREGWGVTNQSAINAVTALFKAKKISKNYALPLPNGHSYYGRGFVQITHPGNYVAMGKRLGIDLYNYPDKALVRKTAAEIMVVGMKEGIFTGKKIADYFTGIDNNPVGARRIINGTDQADRIAGFADKFYNALIIK